MMRPAPPSAVMQPRLRRPAQPRLAQASLSRRSDRRSQRRTRYRGRFRPVRLPVFPDHVVARAFRPFGHRRNHFVRRLAAVERLDQRLHDRHGPVDGARVAPGLEKVRARDMPVAQRRGLVEEQARVDHQADLAHRVGEVEIGRRAVRRVRLADDHQHLHAAGVDVRHQLRERGVLFRRHDLRRRQVRHRCADRGVDRVREGVHRGRL